MQGELTQTTGTTGAVYLVLAAFLGSVVLHSNHGFWSFPGFAAAMLMGVIMVLWVLSHWSVRLRFPVQGLGWMLGLYLLWELVQFSGIISSGQQQLYIIVIRNLALGSRIALLVGALSVAALFGALLFRQVLGLATAPWERVAMRCGFLLLFIAGGIMTIDGGPTPRIDVWHYNQEAARRLANAEPLVGEPYATPLGELQNFPYMPTEAILRTPFWIAFGDVRYAGLAALAMTYLLVLRLATVCGWKGVVPDLLAALVLVQGDVLYVIEACWSEPLALPFAAGGLLALASGRPWVATGLLAAMASIKLWLLIMLLAPFCLIDWRRALAGGVLYVLTIVPVAWKQPSEWVDGVLLLHMSLPDRLDGVSAAGVASRLELQWPTVVGAELWGLAGMGLVAWRLWHGRLSGTSVLAVVATSLLALFFFGKQANPNYYWLLPGLFLIALAASHCGRAPSSAG